MCNQACGHLQSYMQKQNWLINYHVFMFYVVSIAAQAILGLEDCVTLGLIQKVHAIQVQVMLKETDFGDVYKDLGNIGDYHITLKDGITPNSSSLTSSSLSIRQTQVPHSLLVKLKHCLDVNLQYGVLKRVDEPTDWVHNFVIVEKMGVYVCVWIHET